MTKSSGRNEGQNQQEKTSDKMIGKERRKKINRKERVTKLLGRNEGQNQQEKTSEKMIRKERGTKSTGRNE